MKKNLFKLLVLIILPFYILLWSQVRLPVWLKIEEDEIKVYINNKEFNIGDRAIAQNFKKQNIAREVILKDGNDWYFKWRYPNREQSWKEEEGGIILINPNDFDVRFTSEDRVFVLSIHGQPSLTPYENINIALSKNGKEIDKKPFVTGFSREQKIKNVIRLLINNYFSALVIALIVFLLARVSFFLPLKIDRLPRLSQRFKHLPLLLVFSIALISLMVSLFVHYRILDSIPHSKEEVLYLFQAKVFSSGKLYALSHPLKEFFDFEYMINDGKWYSKEPPGVSFFLGLGYLIQRPEIINPIFFTLSIFLIYYLGKTVYGKLEGLIASLLFALSPTLILFSANFFADTANLFFRTAFIIVFLSFLKDWSIKWAALASLFFGLALLTRPYDSLFFLIPFGLFYVFTLAKRFCVKTLKMSLVFLLFILIAVGFYLGYNFTLTGSPFIPTQVVYSKYDFPGFGPRGVEWPIAFGVDEALKNLYFNLLSTAKVIWGWPEYLSFAFVFIAFLLNFKNRYNWLLLGVALSSLVAYFFYHHHGNIYGPRYYVSAFGALALLTSKGICSLFNIISKSNKIFSYVTFGFTILLLTLISVSFNKTYLPKYKDFNGMDRKLLEKAETEIVRPALVFIPARGAWWDYGRFFWTHGPDLSAEIVYALDESDYHLTPYHSEWQRKKWKNTDLLHYFPGRNYYQLKGGKFEPL